MNVIGTVGFSWGNYQIGYDLLSQSTSGNSSRVRIYGVINVSNNYVAWSSGTASAHTASTGLATRYNKGSYTVIANDFTFGHDANGNCSVTIGGSLNTTFTSGSCSGTMTLPHIARYFSKTPSISLSSATTTSLTINWSTSENCNRVRYKLNNGSWVQIWTGSAKSGSFTISGLEPNTSYSIVAECRRADSNLTSNSNTITSTTSAKTSRIRIDGVEREAIPYVYNNGWKIAKPYVRINNNWERSK